MALYIKLVGSSYEFGECIKVPGKKDVLLPWGTAPTDKAACAAVGMPKPMARPVPPQRKVA